MAKKYVMPARPITCKAPRMGAGIIPWRNVSYCNSPGTGTKDDNSRKDIRADNANTGWDKVFGWDRPCCSHACERA